ncbi:conjugal transfer protein, partial [mine drainage metagenome]
MTKNNYPMTDAGQKYLELYAEPVVTNTYLKLALLVLSVVALALLALFYRTETAALRLKPLIISVSDTGRGQVMQYDDFAKIPIDRVSKYYLSAMGTVVLRAQPRHRATRLRQVVELLLEPVQSATIQRFQKRRRSNHFCSIPRSRTSIS